MMVCMIVMYGDGGVLCSVQQEDVTLYYFGVRFLLAKVKLSKETDYMKLTDSDIWCCHQGRNMRRAIEEDIRSLGSFMCSKNKASNCNGFVRMGTSSNFLYQHSTHVKSSNCNYSNFDYISDAISITISCIDRQTCPLQQHFFLSPFFKVDAALKEDKSVVSSVLDSLMEALKTCKVSSHVKYEGYEYAEDDWTKRLIKGMALAQKEYMILGWNAVEASDFGKVRASLGLRLDRDILNCYFHQGAPDILFRHKLSDGETIIDVAAAADVPGAATEWSDTEDTVEVSTQSFPYEKIGELFANIWIQLVDQAIKKLQSGALVPNLLSTKGLYIEKSIGAVYVRVQMPVIDMAKEEEMQCVNVNIDVPPCSVLNEDELCVHLQWLTGCTTCICSTIPNSRT